MGRRRRPTPEEIMALARRVVLLERDRDMIYVELCRAIGEPPDPRMLLSSLYRRRGEEPSAPSGPEVGPGDEPIPLLGRLPPGV